MKSISVVTTVNSPNLLRQGLGFLFFIIAILTAVPAQADINSGLVAWWQFDEGQGYEAQDSSGNGYPIWLDSPTWITPGKFVNAYNINGNPNVRTSTSVDLSTTNQVTVSFWGQYGVGFMLGYSGNNHIFQFSSSGGACGGNYVLVSAANQSCYSWASSNLSAWHHYVAILNNVGGNTLYIDGVQQSAANTSSAGFAQGGGNFTKRPFSITGGEVNDVRIYNRALSSSDVTTLYDLGVNANPAGSSVPTVSLTTPANSATISGTSVSLTATASSNAGMSGVQFKVDGVNVGMEVMSSPYSYSLDTTPLINGNHIISAEAHDINGNIADSSVTVTVSNTPGTPPSTSALWSVVENMVTDFGAKGDAERLTANTTQSSTTITIDAFHSLSSADVGKVIEIFQAGPSTGAGTSQDFISTISSVTDAHTAVLAKAPSQSLTAAYCVIGTNNAPAFQNAVNSAVIPFHANTTANNASINITDYSLSQSDVNKSILIPQASLASYTTLTTTIVSVTDSHDAVLAVAPIQSTNTTETITTGPNAGQTMNAVIVVNSTSVYIYNPNSPNGPLTQSDVGQTITIPVAAGVYQNLLTTIQSVTNSSTAVLAQAPGRTMSAASGTMDLTNGIILYVPQGQYLMVSSQVLNPSGFYMGNNAAVYPAVTITKSGIKFVGEDVNKTVLLGNGAWELDQSGQYVQRGPTFMTAGPSWGVDIASLLPLEFWNLTFDGGVTQGRRAVNGNGPANSITGDGWDITHDAVIDSSSTLLQRLKVFNNDVFIHWRGEILKSTSGGGCTDYTNNTTTAANCQFNVVENSSLLDGNADALNLTFSHSYNNNVIDNVVEGEEFYAGYANQLAGNIIDPQVASNTTESTFTNNIVTNVEKQGMALVGALTSNEVESYRVEGNTFDVIQDCMYFSPSARLTVRNNRFLGGAEAIATNGAGYQPSNGSGDTNHDILIEGNYVSNIYYPFDFSGAYNDLVSGLTFRHNMVVGSGQGMGGSYTMSYDVFSNNYSTGNGFVSNISLAAPYEPEVINDDGSNDYSPTLDTWGNGSTQLISYTTGGSAQLINWTASNSIWLLDDAHPSTLPTYGPNPITPDPSSGPTTFPANPAPPQSGAPLSTAAPAHPTMTIYNYSSWQTLPSAQIYLSANTTGLTPVTLPFDQEMQVTWNGSHWTVTAGPEVPPTVSLTSPTNWAVSTAPANVTLSANASGTNLTKVDFYVNTYLVGTVTQAPFTFNWNSVAYNSFVEESGATVTNVTPGTYLIYAKATDNAGLTAYSTPVSIAVNLPTYSLTVSQSSGETGSGAVTSSPTGISCGSTCSASFNSGASVTLTETPASGSTFAGWSGGGCSGTSSTCVVTMSSSQSVTADFTVSPSSPAYGQVLTTDTSVTLQDAVTVAQYVVGLNPTNFNAANAKVDGNSTITLNDAVLIAKYVVGLITKFPAQN